MKLVHSLLQRVFGALLTAVIPRNMKRILLLTTIYHRMVGDSGLEIQALKELDEKLTLTRTHDPRTLIPFSKLDQTIWGDLDDNLMNCERDSLMKLLRKTPCWLLYGRKDDIVADLSRLQQVVQTSSVLRNA